MVSIGVTSGFLHIQASRDKMECANENLRSDFERWNQIKSRDFKAILNEMADLHIQLYEQVGFTLK